MNHHFQRITTIALLSLVMVMPVCAQMPSSRGKDIAAYRTQIWNKPPAASNWVNDFEGILSVTEEQHMNAQLSDFEHRTSMELTVVTIDTMMVSAARFDSFALHLFNTWGVGKKEKNNGVVVCMSKGYRKIRVCTGYGITSKLSDAATKKIVDNAFIPSFKEGAYAKGLEKGVAAIIAALD